VAVGVDCGRCDQSSEHELVFPTPFRRPGTSPAAASMPGFTGDLSLFEKVRR
jgi:hypothetical protein